MAEHIPEGKERDIRMIGGVAIDGAPIAYIVVLSTVVSVLFLIPFTFALGLGRPFPLSQGVYGLVGMLLGPIAGAITAGIGVYIGSLLAPGNTSLPLVTILGAIVTAFAAGSMVNEKGRGWWWVVAWLYATLSWVYFVWRALFINQISLWPVVGATFINWSALLLYALPTRTLFARWMKEGSWKYMVLGLALGTWTVYGLGHVSAGAIMYHIFNWTEEVWIAIAFLAPLENLVRIALAVVVGSGVITGMRAIGLVKPRHALF